MTRVKMLIIKSKRYAKKCRVGEAGIFHTLLDFSKRLMTLNFAKTVATNLYTAASSDV